MSNDEQLSFSISIDENKKQKEEKTVRKEEEKNGLNKRKSSTVDESEASN